MATGTVKWLSSTKWFGYITPDDGSSDLFADFSALYMGYFTSLKVNQKVSFDLTLGPIGRQVSNIQTI